MPEAGTYVVALTRWGRPPEEEAEALAPIFNASADEVRLRLASPLPIVIAGRIGPPMAARLRDALRERGHGAVLCDLRMVSSSRAMVEARDFELGPTSFAATGAESHRYELSYSEVAALVVAAHPEEARDVREESSEVALPGRVAYLYRKSGQDHVILREKQLRFDGLGDLKGPTRVQNFDTTTDILRKRMPGALFDDRLATRPPKMTGLGPRVSQVDVVDLAAHLVTIAGLQGQL